MSIVGKVESIIHTLESQDMQVLLLEVEQKLPERSNQSSNGSKPRTEDAEGLIHDSFIEQCETFLKDNLRFSQFAKKIERRAEQSLREIEKAEKYMQLKTSVDLQVQVARVAERSRYNLQRQKALDSVCQLLEMPEEYASTLRDSKDSKPNETTDQNFGKAVDFILRQKELIDTLNESTKNLTNKPLVAAMEASNTQLSGLATAKALKAVKQLFENEPALQLIRHYEKLFRVNTSSWQLFLQTYINWRTERLKNLLWPMVSPLDYSFQQPLQAYYTIVFAELDRQLNNQRKMIEEIFKEENTEQLMQQLWPACALQAYTKLERNFLKCIDLLALVTIKRSYHQHIDSLRELFSPKKHANQEEKNQGAFEPTLLTNSIVKIVVCIDAQLKEQREKLTGNKYNIYSVSSYLIISDQLKMALECYQINLPYVSDPTSTCTSFLDPFVELANTRVPTKNNKSLVLFNLNIWEMFRDIWAEQKNITDTKGLLLSQRCSKTLEECSGMLLSMNLTETKNQLFSNTSADRKKVLSQMLQICSADIKKTLHSELSLIIHPALRLQIRDQLNDELLKLYEQELATIVPMENAQLKDLCTELQVNIKALGKAADTVKVYTLQEMKELLEQ